MSKLRLYGMPAMALAGAAISLSVVSRVSAQAPVSGRYSVEGGLLGGYNHGRVRVDGTSEYEWKPGWAAGGWLAIPLGRYVSFEPQVQFSSLTYESSDPLSTSILADATATYVSVPVLLKLHLGRSIALSAGAQFDFITSLDDERNVLEKDDVTANTTAITGGIEFFPHARVALYGRYVHGLVNLDDTGDPSVSEEYFNEVAQVGLKLRLFGRFIPSDSDGDGVADPGDRCVSVVGLARYQGCPIPDSDRDGVNDEQDRCPQVAGEVRFDGCPPPDTDGDGVLDEADRCPQQRGDASNAGCPPPDADGDGILDAVDRCPQEAGPGTTRGCPDSDSDGVANAEDRCPTVPGVREMEGCPAIARFASRDVTFATGSATLTAQGRAELDKVVAYLNEHGDLSVRLDGHTDDTGSDRANVALSQRRADAARQYLIRRGIAATRITAGGNGASQPVAENRTAAGRAQNRRVEVRVR